ncbi:MAG: glycoside hydrolase family 2 TIM barrel-domain containing protein [Eubacteriales bacterium]
MEKKHINPQVFEEKKEKPRFAYRDKTHEKKFIDLNGKWKFSYATCPKLRQKDFYKKEFDTSEWGTIDVPAVWELSGYGKPQYLAYAYPDAIGVRKHQIPSIDEKDNPVGSYRRTFHLDKSYMQGKTIVHFGAVKSAFYLWVNGEYAGYSQGSMTPHEFDISAYIKEGENSISAEVYKYSDGIYLEDQDMWFFAGIYRDVYIYNLPQSHIADVFARSVFEGDKAILFMDVWTNDAEKMQLKVNLLDENINRVIYLETLKSNFVNISAQLEDIKKWSAEQPNLYKIQISLYHDKEILQILEIDFGFREIKIEKGVFYVNDMPVKLKGVNRHDYSPYTGWAVGKELREKDIIIMKENNINALRCSHYPNPSHTYELCNKYGLYVIDEADVESHGIRKTGIPGNDERFKEAMINRAQRMVHRDKNHPCIIMWSLGNEAGDGENFAHMKKAILEIDSTRPIHYEGDIALKKSDVLSLMYPSPEEEEIFGKRLDKELSFFQKLSNKFTADNKGFTKEMYADKPIMNCEFAHAMENSLGNFAEHMEVFEKYDHFMGGFIWDFVDQSIYQDGKWLYGDDFGYKRNHSIYCCNGIVAGDRTLHPSMYEVKKVYQDFAFELNDNRISISNKNYFISSEEYEFTYDIKQNGEVIYRDRLDINPIPPRKRLTCDINIPATDMAGEYTLDIYAKLKKDKIYANAGHIAAWEQFIIADIKKEKKAKLAQLLIKADENQDRILAGNERIHVEIDKKTGALAGIDFGTGNIIKSPLRLNMSRAMTDNDVGLGNFMKFLKPLELTAKWLKYEKKAKVKNISIADEKEHVTIKVTYSLKQASMLEIEYRVHENGVLDILGSILPKTDMVAFGLSGELHSTYENMAWYGRGPHENYWDRKTGAMIGKYEMRASEMTVEYVRPQENGSRADIRHMDVTDNMGHGLHVASDTPFQASLLPNTIEDYETAAHIHELPKRDSVTLTIRSHMIGVGGDVPGIAQLLEKYKLPKGRKYNMCFTVSKAKKQMQ